MERLPVVCVPAIQRKNQINEVVQRRIVVMPAGKVGRVDKGKRNPRESVSSVGRIDGIPHFRRIDVFRHGRVFEVEIRVLLRGHQGRVVFPAFIQPKHTPFLDEIALFRLHVEDIIRFVEQNHAGVALPGFRVDLKHLVMDAFGLPNIDVEIRRVALRVLAVHFEL